MKQRLSVVHVMAILWFVEFAKHIIATTMLDAVRHMQVLPDHIVLLGAAFVLLSNRDSWLHRP